MRTSAESNGPAFREDRSTSHQQKTHPAEPFKPLPALFTIANSPFTDLLCPQSPTAFTIRRYTLSPKAAGAGLSYRQAHLPYIPSMGRSSKLSDRFLFTSESVTEGHPDKIADQVSDAILDACLEQGPYSRVAAETLTATGLVVIAGEITTKAYVDFQSLVRGVVASIGYDNALYGFDSNTCAVISSINKQSGDIAQGVDTGGAGD